jgi:hypothetical protein
MAYIEQARSSTPICSSDAECAAKWAAARKWVQTHGFLDIETESETEIRTYEMIGKFTVETNAIVTKVPVGDGSYKILARFGIHAPSQAPTYPPSFAKLVVQFNQDVNQAWPTNR